MMGIEIDQIEQWAKVKVFLFKNIDSTILKMKQNNYEEELMDRTVFSIV